MAVKASTNVEEGKIEIVVTNGNQSMSYSLSPDNAELLAISISALAKALQDHATKKQDRMRGIHVS